MTDVVRRTLIDFAAFIGLSAEEIEGLNAADSELLLKKLLASQTKDVGNYICANLDPDDVDRMHIETQGDVWQYGQSRSIDSQFYAYIFGNADISPEIEHNDAFTQFKETLGGFKDNRVALRLFHALNLHNMREEVAATVGNEMFNVANVCDGMKMYLKEIEGPSREHVKDDLTDLWERDVRFPFFQDKRVVIGVDVKEKEAVAAAVAVKKPMILVSNDNVTVSSEALRKNALLKRFCTVNDVPMSFPVTRAAKQLVLVTTNSVPERVQEQLRTLLHRDQNVDQLWQSRAQFTHPKDSEQFREIATAVAASIPTLSEQVNACPECRLYDNPKKLTGATEFMQDYLCHLRETQGCLGKKWVKIISDQ